MTKISVIMPVYNTNETYLKKAIESILSQTYKDFEFLIIDDASDTNISDIVSAYKDSRIKFHRLDENRGASGARNYALDHACGEYIAVMDSDDIAFPDRFEKQLAYFNQHPEVGCLGGQIEVIGDDKSKLEFPQLNSNQEIEAFLAFMGCVFCHSTVMIKRDILEKNHIRYNAHYILAEDYDLWVSLMGNTQFAIMPDKLIYYRFHFENISHRKKHLLATSTSEVQKSAIKKYCSLSNDNYINTLFKLLRNEPINENEILSIDKEIKFIIEQLPKERAPFVIHLLHKRLKKQYYKTHSLSNLILLSRSPLNQLLGISIGFRLFCIITRGLFSFKK